MVPVHVTFDLNLDLEHILDAGLYTCMGTIVCKCGGDPVICLRIIANYNADRQTDTRQTRLTIDTTFHEPFFQNPAISRENGVISTTMFICIHSEINCERMRYIFDHIASNLLPHYFVNFDVQHCTVPLCSHTPEYTCTASVV